MKPSLFLLPVLLLVPEALAVTAGSFENVGNTLVSAMMMFLGNDNKVYIIDKAEGNAAQVAGHPAWGSVWDINTQETTAMDIKTNTFCSSGLHLPNGSYVTFGGNSAVGPGASKGSSGSWDATYQDFDGGRSIRVLNPCSSPANSDDFAAAQCQWFDDPDTLSMQKQRWYSAAEALGDGTIGTSSATTLTDPTIGAELTYEFYPANGRAPQNLNFLFKTSGLNAYPHTFLLSSGKLLLQANVSTMIWDSDTNTETDLPDMPHGIVRVYPASGATAMLPMTPANDYSQTILFCGGSDMDDTEWGDFVGPHINTWERPASKDCQRITPEPADGSSPEYVQDDDMLEDGKLLVLNGGLNGTAGEATMWRNDSENPFAESYASGPVGTPAIYDPNAPLGSRWSNAGLSNSPIARLYHSSAILLPDASVFVAGSNPNLDVNTSSAVPYPTEYRAEKFIPRISLPARAPHHLVFPQHSPMVETRRYYHSATSYSGSSNTAANNTIVSVIRGGWTTHAMNMGQRFLQLNNTYSVQNDGSIVLHVSQMPPNPNLFQPGPALLFVVVNGIPSNGTYLLIGSGNVEAQPTKGASVLPPSILQADASGSGGGSGSSSGGANALPGASGATSNTVLISAITGGVGLVVLMSLL
ncbi:glyoxal oxidase N-terminus-domain-containing protein [Mycena rosella]|uniref:Glyoxal oxidase N-terminus-domain-containing protein n=1 Tax=Mycena rosella TaxID=1033263 RepID=A0AAD7DRT6_MYCRO|nr:glyoxal oxidase N-terminus-domain-containing protein [Mycena rosella]